MAEEIKCVCSAVMDYVDGLYVCVNPDCELDTDSSTLLLKYEKGVTNGERNAH